MTSGKRGRFISLEGGEGVGKSTQGRALAAWLRERGMDIVETREPGGSPGAEAIRSLLLDGTADAWQPRAEALLFAAARSDHVARSIEPALASGRWVLCDRFVDSTRAYQAGYDGLDDATILRLHAIGSRGLLPDRTLLLEAGSEASLGRRLARALDRPDRFEARDEAYHAEVRAAFARLAEGEPARFRRVDASGSIETVTRGCIDAIRDLVEPQ